MFQHASLGRMENNSLPGVNVHDIFNDCYFLIKNMFTHVVESNPSGFVIRNELLKYKVITLAGRTGVVSGNWLSMFCLTLKPAEHWKHG